MKLKITTSQLREMLKSQSVHFPITIIMKGIDQDELKAITRLLKKTKRDN
jgi:hypothetical protein